jgi:hypothetical protein
MTMLSLLEAAQQVGKSKSTLALMAPTVSAGACRNGGAGRDPVEPEPRRSWLRWWFSLKAAG